METCFNYCDKEKAFFSSDERRWINRIHRLKAKFPDRVIILKEPEENDGCIYAQLPIAALKINLISRPEVTDEQIAILKERLKLARNSAEDVGKEK